MRSKWMGVLVLSGMACMNAGATGAAHYLNVEMDLQLGGKTLAHQSIAEAGKPVSITQNREGRPELRVDYAVDNIAPDENGNLAGLVSGKVFAPQADGSWQLAGDFSAPVKMGQPLHIEQKMAHTDAVVDVRVQPLTPGQVQAQLARIKR